MTVSELIEQLQALDMPDAPVCRFDAEWDNYIGFTFVDKCEGHCNMKHPANFECRPGHGIDGDAEAEKTAIALLG